jgi:hypothetical protein
MGHSFGGTLTQLLVADYALEWATTNARAYATPDE